MKQSQIVVFDKLTKKYGQHLGIQDLSFTIEEGEIFGFLGPNGAGKTTTIRLMLDLIKPSSGTVRIFGKEVRKHSYEIRKKMGYLPGNFTPYDKMTGEEFLRFSRQIRDLKDPIDPSLFNRLELSLKDQQKKIREYSQGMKQKLGIIHAIAHHPDLIILDEPSTGLDPLMQDALYELILEMKSRGSTIFFSSHNLPEVEKICEKVAIVKESKLVGCESLASLRKRKQKKMKLSLKNKPAQAPALKNAQYLSSNLDGFEYLVDGDIKDLLQELSQLEVSNLLFPEPNLEDIFLSYYEKKHKSHENSI
jgi:ABC-2 type transport system ATP-binding protein